MTALPAFDRLTKKVSADLIKCVAVDQHRDGLGQIARIESQRPRYSFDSPQALGSSISSVKSTVTVCALAVAKLTVKVALTVPALLLRDRDIVDSDFRLAVAHGRGAVSRVRLRPKKSLALSLVSRQPPALRKSAVVLPGVPLADPSKQLAVPP